MQQVWEESAAGWGPRDEEVADEWVDVRDASIASYVGHGESRSGDAGHDADWGATSGPTGDDDARWIDGSSLL